MPRKKKDEEELSEEEKKERQKKYTNSIKTVLESPTTVGAQIKIYKDDTLSQGILDIINLHSPNFKGNEKTLVKKIELLKYIGFGNTVSLSAQKAGVSRQFHYSWSEEDNNYFLAYKAVVIGSREDDIENTKARIGHSVSMFYNAGIEFLKMGDPEMGYKYLSKASDNDFKRLNYHLQEKQAVINEELLILKKKELELKERAILLAEAQNKSQLTQPSQLEVIIRGISGITDSLPNNFSENE